MDRFEQLSEDIGAISPAATPDGPEKTLDDPALMRLHAARGEPRVFLNKLRRDARTKLVDILKQASDELRQRKTEYDVAPAPKGTRKPPYALSYEKFPRGSMGRIMMLLNLWATELVAGCPTACGFCSSCAVPVKTDALDPIPVDQVETLFDELFDAVGELTGGDEKLQLGALNKIIGYLATDSFYYEFIEQLLLYLKKKGVGDVVLSTTLPKEGREVFERLSHHLWLKRQISELGKFTSTWKKNREIVGKVFPPNVANLPLPQLMELLESNENLCHLMQLIAISLHALKLLVSFGVPLTKIKISDPWFTKFLNSQEKAALETSGVKPTQTIESALKLLRKNVMAKMKKVERPESFEQLVQDFGYMGRRKQMESELKEKLTDESREAAALPPGEKSAAMADIGKRMMAVRQQTKEAIPTPANVDFLEKSARFAESLRREIRKNQELLHPSDPAITTKTKADNDLLLSLNLPDMATLESDPDRDSIIAAKIAELQAQLGDYPEIVGLRISTLKRRTGAVSKLKRGQFYFTQEERYPLKSEWRRERGRSFDKKHPEVEPDISFRVGVVLTPYGTENTVPVSNSTDCTSSLLRVPFENFEDNPKPVEPETPLFSVLAHVIVIMSKRNTQKDFFFAFDGVNVRKITFDKNTHVVKQDEILYGPIQTMDDIRKFFKFRGTLTPKCATCKECFGIVPKRPEEIEAKKTA